MARQPLPAIPFTTTGGLVTKVNPHLVGPNGMVLCQNADTFKEYGSLSKIAGSTRVSDEAPEPWESLHPYEHRSLSGEFRRHVIGLAGDTLYRINSDKTLTSLNTGMVADSLSGVVASDKLYLTSALNDPIKVDSGGLVTQWGITPPGDERTMIEAFDDASDWTPTDCALTDADGVIDSNESVAVEKSDTSVTTVSFTRSTISSPLLLKRYWFLSVFIPEGVLSLLADGGTIAGFPPVVTDSPISVLIDVGLGGSNPTWNLEYGDLVEGRNLIEYEGGFDGFLVQNITITINTKSASSVFSDLRFDSFYVTDGGFPIADPGASFGGTVSGEVRYRVTFVSKYGQESNAGRISDSFDATGAGVVTVAVKFIPVSTDTQVIARRLYRDQDGDSIFRFVTQINDNTTTTFTDTDGFAALSNDTCPLAGDSAKDYSRPNKMVQVISWNGFLLGIDANVRTQLNVNYKGRNEAWPISRRVSFDYTITALVPTLLGVFVFGKDRSTILRGTEWDSFDFEETGPEQSVGCSGKRAWAPFKGIATVWHDVGPYIQNGIDPWYMGNAIKDQIEALDASLFEDLIAAHDRLNFRQIYATGTDHRTLFAYGYGREGGQISPEGSGIDPLDIRRGHWRTISLPTSVKPKCFAIVERPGDKPELWAGCDDGFVYWIGDPDALDWAVGMGSEAIDCDIEWEWSEHPKGVQIVARFLDVSMTSSVPSTWDYTVTVTNEIEGAATFTTTGTILVNGTTDEQITMPAGLAGDFIKLRLRNNRAGEDGTIRRANVQIIPRREQREEAAA